MIHYELQCADGHGFDGWFPGSAAFESQAERGLLSCPICGSAQVRRGLMAPAVPRKSNAGAVVPPKAVAVPPDGVPVLPDALRAALQRLRAEVEAHCDHVGDDFAEEARRIHHGEAPLRPIYGDATQDEAEALADEGIEVGRIPWLPRADG
jgi:hypothetical protein